MPVFNSTAIIRAEYNPETEEMQVWFPDAGPYDFCGVPERVWEGLLDAKSKGSFYNVHIRDKYQC